MVLYWSGGILNGLLYNEHIFEATSVLSVKDVARKAQFGEIFTFDFKTSSGDGVFRTSPRGWYSFSHTALGKLFFFGHLWHASLISRYTSHEVQYGEYEKLGDLTTKTSRFIHLQVIISFYSMGTVIGLGPRVFSVFQCIELDG